MPGTIQIICFSSSKRLFDSETERYIRLLRPYISLSVKTLKQSPYSNTKELLKIQERIMCKKWLDNSYPIALTEEGVSYTSILFAQWLSKKLTMGVPMVFNIGSAYGMSPSFKKKCQETISLSPMTMPNRMCLMVLVEQLYRAFTILKGHPYHK